MKRFLAPLFLCLLPTLAAAQGGVLERLLESKLSSDARTVDVTGFEGALSSTATLDEMTIADRNGVWLTLRDAELDWSRTALLRGKLKVDKLTAGEILLPRLPEGEPAPPSPEATPFQLPELPVSVDIGQISAERVVLGEALFGQAAEISLDGSITLAGGEGQARLSVDRLDGPRGKIDLDAGYSNDTDVLAIDLVADEGPGGIVATLIDLPGKPALRLTAKADDPLSDFTSDITLATDGEERLSGTVTLADVAADEAGADTPARRFSVDIGGDLAPVLPEDYRPFFGDETALKAAGTRYGDGRLTLDTLDLSAAALTLSGSLAVAADGLPQRFDLSGRLGQEGGRVRLPVSGPAATLASARISADFDAAEGDRWQARADFEKFRRGPVKIASGELSGDGTISRGDGAPAGVTAMLRLAANGLSHTDTALQSALGDTLSGRADIDWQKGAPLKLSTLRLRGAGAQLAASGTIDGFSSSFRVDGTAELSADDLARFAALAGRPLDGAGTVTLSGSGAPLDGTFDLDLDLDATDLAVGEERIDPLLTGESSLAIVARRGTDGTALKRFALDATGLSADASGTLDSNAGDLRVDVTLPEAGRVVDTLAGEVTAGADVSWQKDSPIQLTGLKVAGPDLDVAATGKVDIDAEGFPASGDITARVGRLSRFSPLVGRDLGGAISLEASGSGTPGKRLFDIVLDASATDLAVGEDRVDPLLTGESRLRLDAERSAEGAELRRFSLDASGVTASASGSLANGTGDLRIDATLPEAGRVVDTLAGKFTAGADVSYTEGQPVQLSGLEVTGPDLELQATGRVDPVAEGYPASGRLSAQIRRLSRFSPLVGRDLGGAISLEASGSGTPGKRLFDIVLDASATDLAVGEERVDPLLTGESRLRLDAERSADSAELRRFSLDASGVTASASGSLANGTGDLRIDATLPEAGRVLDTLSGKVTAGADLRYEEDGPVRLSDLEVTGPDLDLRGSGELDLAAEGMPASGSLRAEVGELSRFSELAGRPLGGRISAEISGEGEITGQSFDLTASATARDLATGVATADRLLAGGETRLDAAVARKEGRLRIGRLDLDAPQLIASVSDTGDDSGTLNVDARLADLGLIVPRYSGPATASGTVRPDGRDYVLDLQASGPGGISARIDGRVAGDGTADLSAHGSAPLGLANPFIAPRTLSGPVDFDLSLAGQPGLSALSGQATMQGAQLSLPSLGMSLEGLGGRVDLSGGEARVSLQSQVSAGGRLSVEGPVRLSPPFRSDLSVSLDTITLRDPRLYETTASGDLSVTGPLTGAGRVAGEIALGKVELKVPSTGLGGGGPVPDGLVHRNASAETQATRRRAGLTESEDSADGGGGGLGLDILIRAENRVFLRGRGLDAELGGRVRLTGTTSDVIPIGGIDLIRGRLDILGQRLELTEGSARLQGALVPYIRLVAETETDEVTVQIVVEGPAGSPEVTFTSQPELPQEEVLARLLFGRDVTSLSPLQAAQLASAVATLAGRGGGGVISNLRQQFGLDDLDVTTTEEGGAALRAGKYISENVYTDVTVGSDGTSEVNLNLDVSPSVTVRGGVDASGGSGVGVFYERDY